VLQAEGTAGAGRARAAGSGTQSPEQPQVAERRLWRARWHAPSLRDSWAGRRPAPARLGASGQRSAAREAVYGSVGSGTRHAPSARPAFSVSSHSMPPRWAAAAGCRPWAARAQAPAAAEAAQSRPRSAARGTTRPQASPASREPPASLLWRVAAAVSAAHTRRSKALRTRLPQRRALRPSSWPTAPRRALRLAAQRAAAAQAARAQVTGGGRSGAVWRNCTGDSREGPATQAPWAVTHAARKQQTRDEA